MSHDPPHGHRRWRRAGRGFRCRRSALKRGGAASGCRGLGQHARWAPAVKEL